LADCDFSCVFADGADRDGVGVSAVSMTDPEITTTATKIASTSESLM
jgi:hypothetical protein